MELPKYALAMMSGASALLTISSVMNGEWLFAGLTALFVVQTAFLFAVLNKYDKEKAEFENRHR